MATAGLPFWGPQDFERPALLRMLESADRIGKLLNAVSPKTAATLLLSAAEYDPDLVEDSSSSLVFRVPWNSGPPRPPVVLVTELLTERLDPRKVAERLNLYLVETLRRQVRTANMTMPEMTDSSDGSDTMDMVAPPADMQGEAGQMRTSPLLYLLVYLGREPWTFEVDNDRLRKLPPDLTGIEPRFRLLFLGVRHADAATLRGGGLAGDLLWLLSLDRSAGRQFIPAFEHVLARQEAIPPNPTVEPVRRTAVWFLLHLMLRRGVDEFPRLRQGLLAAFSDITRRRETEAAMRTIFDSCAEMGELKARREVLLDLMSAKFGAVPTEDVALVNRISNVQKLDDLLRRVLSAKDIDAVGLWDRPDAD